MRKGIIALVIAAVMFATPVLGLVAVSVLLVTTGAPDASLGGIEDEEDTGDNCAPTGGFGPDGSEPDPDWQENQDDEEAPGGSDGPPGETADTFNNEQIQMTKVIIGVGKARNVDPFGYVIALMTAFQESRLQNLDDGDADSVGIFQQRPSAGWGSKDQLTDPVYAATAFYGGDDVPPKNPGLMDVTGWALKHAGHAAQEVQASAHPEAYADHEKLARELISRYGNDKQSPAVEGVTESKDSKPRPTTEQSGNQCGPGQMATCETSPSLNDAIKGMKPDTVRVTSCIQSKWEQITTYYGVREDPQPDHPEGRAVDIMLSSAHNDHNSDEAVKLGTEVRDWLRSNAQNLGVQYIIYRQQIWSVERDGEDWRDMSDRGGDTANHMDHIHVTTFGDSGTDMADQAGEIVSVGNGKWTGPMKHGNYSLTARFGQRGALWASGFHTGLDFASSNHQEPLIAMHDGTVVDVGSSGPYGNSVVIKYSKTVKSRQAHASHIRVKVGDKVKAGQQIGTQGETGNVEGAHCHVEIFVKDVLTDPQEFLERRGVPVG